MSHRYQPYWCEENVWWLCQEPALQPHACWVLFVSNERKSCALWKQRAGDPVLWDYHVLLVVERAAPEAWDLDTTLGMPIALGAYLDATFRPVPAVLAPRFRRVAADEYIGRFHTDRSHMRASDGRWREPPPPWPPPASGHVPNQQRFWDLDDAFCGEVIALAELRARFGV
jgi:protein N-terminal glutamine amidohydrolase